MEGYGIFYLGGLKEQLLKYQANIKFISEGWRVAVEMEMGQLKGGESNINTRDLMIMKYNYYLKYNPCYE